MLEFEEYKVKLNNAKPALEVLRGALKLDAAQKEIEELEAASERDGRFGRTQVKDLTLWFEGDSLTRWEGEYFPEQDQALAKRMGRFGNLPKDKKKGGG